MSGNMESNNQPASEPEFRAFRKRVLTRVLIMCIIGLPIGIVLEIPYVWGLSIVGIVVGSIRLVTLKE